MRSGSRIYWKKARGMILQAPQEAQFTPFDEASKPVLQKFYSFQGSILNATYLVPISGKLQFKMQTTKIATEFEAFGIQIEVSGPWPPYHFIDIDLNGNVAMEGILV